MEGAIEFPGTSNAEQLVLCSMALPFNRALSGLSRVWIANGSRLT